MGFTARLKGRTPPLLVDYLLSALSLKGAPRAPKTPKAKEKHEGEVVVDTEFPPSWSDAETDGGGVRRRDGRRRTSFPPNSKLPPEKCQKIRLARRWLVVAPNVLGSGSKGGGASKCY